MEVFMTSGLLFGIICFVAMCLSGLFSAFCFNRADTNFLYNQRCNDGTDRSFVGWIAAGIALGIFFIVCLVGVFNIGNKLIEKLNF